VGLADTEATEITLHNRLLKASLIGVRSSLQHAIEDINTSLSTVQAATNTEVDSIARCVSDDSGDSEGESEGDSEGDSEHVAAAHTSQPNHERKKVLLLAGTYKGRSGEIVGAVNARRLRVEVLVECGECQVRRSSVRPPTPRESGDTTINPSPQLSTPRTIKKGQKLQVVSKDSPYVGIVGKVTRFNNRSVWLKYDEQTVTVNKEKPSLQYC
jgi:hypothetical protein